MKTSELLKLLKDAGCYKIRNGANHDVWFSPQTNRQFTVPRHGAKEVKTGTAQNIIKVAGIK